MRNLIKYVLGGFRRDPFEGRPSSRISYEEVDEQGRKTSTIIQTDRSPNEEPTKRNEEFTSLVKLLRIGINQIPENGTFWADLEPLIEQNTPYKIVERVQHSGMRKQIFRVREKSADPKKGRTFILKADLDSQDPEILRYFAEGKGVAAEIKAMTGMDIQDALDNNISPLIHPGEILGLKYFVEPDFTGCQTLREATEGGRPLNPNEWRQLMQGVLKAEKQLVDGWGYFHRDLNSSNILIRRKSGNLETRLTDLGTAGRVDASEKKYDPTSGSRSVKDPLLSSSFTGKDGQYTLGSEIYAIGINALQAATGRLPIRYDDKAGTAIDLFSNGESILGDDGRIDKERHSQAVEKALQRMPRELINNIHWIRKALSIDPSERYVRLDDLISDFYKVNN